MMRTIVFVVVLLWASMCECARFPGYQVTSMTKQAYGWQGTLQLISPGPYGSDINTLTIQVYFQTAQTLRIKIYDPNNQRWEVPNIALTPLPTTQPDTTDYTFSYESNPFGFAITRTSTNDVIFNTSSSLFNGLIFEDQYLEVSTILPQQPNIYGLGERVYSLQLQTGQTYTMFSRDQGTPVQKNLYGFHPFYLEMRSSGNAHGVFLLNSNAMDVVLQPGYLTYKTTGGILDFFVFLGPNPDDVIQEYQTVVGFPHFPPYWSLGFHQCRWGYVSIAETMEVVANYSKYNLPLDTMWNDIDYMDNYKDFTNDPNNYPQDQVRSFTQQLHANGQHYMMIIDPGISNTPGYAPYDQLIQSGAYVKAYGTNTPILGKVWPGLVNFPDFFHPNATSYWSAQISAFHSQGPEFDGMWIDMNEISNFCNGQCAIENVELSSLAQKLGTNWDNPPYVPGGTNLDTNTVNITAQQYNGIMYNTHSMYGYSEGLVTKIALESLFGKRSVIISRSSFAGSGAHHGHWLGDNNSQFQDLYYSIPGILAMNMFGIAQVGADICGFGGNTNEELCSRWMQLGTLYPFSRNHNAKGQISQEPWAFGQTLIDISRDSLNRRYTLLPYLYTLFAGAHNNGTTVWRPLFFEFPSDVNTYPIDHQFLIGQSLLVTPVLTQGATSVSGYFPQGVWYDYYNGTALTGSFPQTVNLDAPLTKIPIHIRGGSVIPTQAPALTTTAARLNPFSLTVALDQNGFAQGQIYLDDGETLNTMENNNYTYVRWTAQANSPTTTLSNAVYAKAFEPAASAVLNNVTVLGVTAAPGKVTINGAGATFNYAPTTSTLSITTINLAITATLEIIWD